MSLLLSSVLVITWNCPERNCCLQPCSSPGRKVPCARVAWMMDPPPPPHLPGGFAQGESEVFSQFNLGDSVIFRCFRVEAEFGLDDFYGSLPTQDSR